ncbi:MAG: (2Fe-2S) ferredoxin domain-containing protein [Proteobacteria bacterium]|nr:(2Fe-2S) ferredoxin domain-containing protein [Pseudomonadota bacterium]
MAKPEKMIFVCNKQRPAGHPRGSCAEKGAMDLPMAFSEALDSKNLFAKVSLATTGCLGPCHLGPLALVMPGNVWYKGLTKGDVNDIVSEHIEGGKPVERLIVTDEDWDN